MSIDTKNKLRDAALKYHESCTKSTKLRAIKRRIKMKGLRARTKGARSMTLASIRNNKFKLKKAPTRTRAPVRTGLPKRRSVARTGARAARLARAPKRTPTKPKKTSTRPPSRTGLLKQQAKARTKVREARRMQALLAKMRKAGYKI